VSVLKKPCSVRIIMEFYQKWTDFLSFPIILNAVAHIVDVVTGKVRHNKHTENRGRVIREEVRL
jgi:hypothetical protein